MSSLSTHSGLRRRPGLRLRTAALVLLVAVAAVGAVTLSRGLLSLPNPFGSRTVDRTQPALMQSLADLHEFHAASANYQVIVDVEKDYKWVPSFVRGERTLFVANGSVDAVVDFTGLDARNVQVSPDRRAVTVTVPPVSLAPARLDADRSYVATRERGVLDRIGGAVGDTSNDTQVYRLAEDKLDRAAAADPRIRRQAEQNTRQTLDRMIRALGFERLTVRFAPDVR